MGVERVEDVALDPRNTKPMSEADCVGRAGTPGRGPYMVIHLEIKEGQIAGASCQTYGCPTAIACGSKLTEWIKGKSPSEASTITDGQIRSWFEKYPLGKWHCARIAATALRDAVANCGRAAH